MVKTQKLYFSPDVVLYPLLFVIIMWLVFWFEIRFGEDFTPYGIHPGRVEGIRGILFGPFIHGNLKHLFNNSIPMLVLGTALFYFYRPLRWQVFILGFVITGLITWAIGRPANHIGASGIVYLLASFLFFKGIISKQYQLTALSFVVVFVYGSLLWYVFPLDTHISWEGHLSGFGVGLLLAFLYTKVQPQSPIKNLIGKLKITCPRMTLLCSNLMQMEILLKSNKPQMTSN